MASLVPRLALFAIAACSVVGSGQTLSDTLAKAPPDIDEALQTRVKQFYDLLAAGKFRQAEALVAEDSKDRYYSSDKDKIEEFKLIKIVYEENYTKATAVATRRINMSVPMAGQTVQITGTFSSRWKIENGQWCWYLPPEPEYIETPYGKMKNPRFGGPKPPEKIDFEAEAKKAKAEAAALAERTQAGVRVDTNTLQLLGGKNSKAELSITNGLPGSVKLKLEAAAIPGLEVKLEKEDLGSNESTRLVAHYVPGSKAAARQTVSLLVRVEPTGQTIPITLHFAAHPKS